ncbi:MAG: tyrosine-type recombinase/integrase [Chloroflexota bacterium]|nr:tyrosine-type recombinase/integrase [Chloroflexota bacterium]
MKLEEVVEEFMLDCRARGLSQSTLDWYEKLLGHFAAFIGSDADDITPSDCRAFMAHLHTVKAYEGHPTRDPDSKGLSNSYIHAHWRALRRLFRWSVEEELLKTNPMASIKAPKLEYKLPRVLEDHEVRALLDACSTSLSVRNRAIILLFLDTGIRVGELVGARIEDIKNSQGLLKVRGKGRKERLVPLSETVLKALRGYISHRSSGPIFLARRGTPLTAQGVRMMLRRRCEWAGLERIGPHALRHTFARNWVRRGGDLESLRRILGHASLETVRIYLRMVGNDLKAIHRRVSPVGGVGFAVQLNLWEESESCTMV